MSEETTPSTPFQAYEDLIFDLCHATVEDPSLARQVFDSIRKALESTRPEDRFQTHERSWVFHVACEEILDFHRGIEETSPLEDQIGLDALTSSAARLKHFTSYFSRLLPEDRLLLLLRDKYGLPYPEIAAALGVSEDSLKARRARSIRTLEEWVWTER